VGRGASSNPPNRFEKLRVEPVPEDLAGYFEDPDPERKVPTSFYLDRTRTILAKNDSPDVSFTFSINPYRGCEHGCIYCYARPSHEYLGFSSGLDFETKILVKMDAPELLARALNNPRWQPQVVALSGNTDCYQPIERKLELTRRCLETFLRFRNPVSITTKNVLIRRDLDLLAELARHQLVSVALSVTTLDPDLVRVMEPRTATPTQRLQTIELLAAAGIPVGTLIAPVIPGLTESEIPAILREASTSGARFAGMLMLRLPYAVKDLFVEWLRLRFPDRASRVINSIRSIREGKLTESAFGKRARGEGPVYEAIERLFHASCRRFHISQERPALCIEGFLSERSTQMQLL
jgi:DNA repair photolyase